MAQVCRVGFACGVLTPLQRKFYSNAVTNRNTGLDILEKFYVPGNSSAIKLSLRRTLVLKDGFQLSTPCSMPKPEDEG